MTRLAAPLSNQQIASYVRQAGFPEELVPRMVAIANAESSRIPNNRNFKGSDQSYGLFQINMLGGMGPERRQQFGIASNEELYDPLTNAKAAKAIYDQQGLGAWSVHRSGAADRFMPGADEIRRTTDTTDTTPATPSIQSDFNSPTGNVTINNYYGDGTETQQKKQKSFAQRYIDNMLSGRGGMNLGQQLVRSMMTGGSSYGGKLNPLNVLSLFNQ